VTSSAVLNTTAKSVSNSECFAEWISFLFWHPPSEIPNAMTAAKKMIRFSRCMGGRPRNSTPQPARGAGKATPQAAVAIAALLAEKWPDAVVELDHKNPYELLVATILSAQSTDKMINTITPALFAKYPDPTSLSHATQDELEPMIFKSGFYRNKAKSLLGMARAVVERHGGTIPDTMEELVELPGVARKTANVVLGSAFGKPAGVVVDTHVNRLANRLGLTTEDDPVKIEQDLMRLLPREQWTPFAHRLIWHGRRVCFAKQPDCNNCLLAPRCPSAAIVELAPTTKATKPEKRRA
jgi:endonuclease-3